MMAHRTMLRTRLLYAALALLTIAIGLLVHLRGSALGAVVRDVLGDALWAAMIVWWIGVVAPRARPVVRGGVALTVCVLVECSQLLHSPSLDALRATRAGHLVLGSGFDPRDLLAYALGVMIAMILDRMLVSQRTG